VFPDTYHQINSVPTPLLTFGRPDTFHLLMQERPASRLSCVSLVHPRAVAIPVVEQPDSVLSCVSLVCNTSVPINATENPDSVLSCISLYHLPEIDIPITEQPDSALSCVSLFHPTEIDVPAGEEVGAAISCVSLFHPMNTKIFPLTDCNGLYQSFAHGLSAPPTCIRMVLLCTTDDTGGSNLTVGDELDVPFTFDIGNMVPAFGCWSDAVNITVTYDGQWGNQICCLTGIFGTINLFVSMTNFSLKIYWY